MAGGYSILILTNTKHPPYYLLLIWPATAFNAHFDQYKAPPIGRGRRSCRRHPVPAAPSLDTSLPVTYADKPAGRYGALIGHYRAQGTGGGGTRRGRWRCSRRGRDSRRETGPAPDAWARCGHEEHGHEEQLIN